MAREVRELRKQHKLTQKQLAAASGINQGEISRIERGQTNPTAATLAALLAPLGARLGVVTREGRDLGWRSPVSATLRVGGRFQQVWADLRTPLSPKKLGEGSIAWQRHEPCIVG